MDIKPSTVLTSISQALKTSELSSQPLKTQAENQIPSTTEIIQGNNLAKTLRNTLIENVLVINSYPLSPKQVNNLPPSTPILSRIYFQNNHYLKTSQNTRYLTILETNPSRKPQISNKLFLLSDFNIKKIFANTNLDLLTNNNTQIIVKQKSFLDSSIFNQIYYSNISKSSEHIDTTKNSSNSINTKIFNHLNLIKLPSSSDKENHNSFIAEIIKSLQSQFGFGSSKNIYNIYTRILIALIQSSESNLNSDFSTDIKSLINLVTTQKPAQPNSSPENIFLNNSHILSDPQLQGLLIEQWKKHHKDLWRSYYESSHTETNINFATIPLQISKKTVPIQIKLETNKKDNNDKNEFKNNYWKIEVEIEIKPKNCLLIYSRNLDSNLNITIGASTPELFEKISQKEHQLTNLLHLLKNKAVNLNFDKNLILSIHKIVIPQQSIEA